MDWLRQALCPSWTVSSSPARTWLHLVFRLSVFALGLCVVLNASRLYGWTAIGVVLVCFFADWPLYRRDKRLGRVVKRRLGYPPPEGWPTESTIQRLRRRRS